MAAAAALAAGASAYAANPFSDVSTSDWAYQAVSDLSTQGVVEGYPDGTFKGEKNITRYEMAQIIARLMAKEDQLNAEQRATVDKLAGEYADELENLGVRVANLEKKVGNISWSGDARIRYQRGLGIDSTLVYPSTGVNYPITDRHNDRYDGRLRINVSGQVNDKVTVEGRFLTDMYFKDAGEDDGDTTMDRLHVVYAPNERTSIDVGRTDLWLGQTGVLYDDTFDGIKVSYGTDRFGIEAGYGRPIAVDPQALMYVGLNKDLKTDKSQLESYYVQARAKAGSVQLNAFYLDFVQESQMVRSWNEAGVPSDADFKLWGIGTAIQLNEKWVLDGDYIQNPGKYMFTNSNGGKREYLNKPTLWTVGLTYGKVDTEKPGSYSIGMRYVDADALAYLGSSTLDMTDYLSASWQGFTGLDTGNYGWTYGAKFWLVKAGVAVAKNVELDAYYYFNAKAKKLASFDSTKPGSKDFDDIYGIELNYTF